MAPSPRDFAEAGHHNGCLREEEDRKQVDCMRNLMSLIFPEVFEFRKIVSDCRINLDVSRILSGLGPSSPCFGDPIAANFPPLSPPPPPPPPLPLPQLFPPCF